MAVPNENGRLHLTGVHQKPPVSFHFHTFPSFLQTFIFKNELFTYTFSFLKMNICRNERNVWKYKLRV